MPIAPTTWNSRGTVNPRTAGQQDQVRVIQLRDGTYWVAWRDYDNSGVGSPAGGDLIGQRYNVLGQAVGGEVRLNAITGNTEQNASFAAATDSSQFFMAYESYVDTGEFSLYGDIYVQKLNANGTADPAAAMISIVDADGAYSDVAIRNPDIAVASATNGLIVYELQTPAGGIDVVGRYFNPETMSVGGVVTLFNDPDGDDAVEPQVIALSSGNYLVVLRNEWGGSGSDFDVVGKIVNQAGGVVNPSINIASSGSNEAEVSVAALVGGGFVVTYTNTGAEAGNVYARMYDNGGTATSGLIAVADGINQQGHSSVAATGDGGFVVAWRVGASGIYARSYDAAGLPAGAADVFAFGSFGPSTSVALASLADGRIVMGTGADGNIQSGILDPRAAANATPAYAPTSRQVGTVGDDVLTAATDVGVVYGWNGNDTITDGNGTEGLLSGGAGNDIIVMHGADANEDADGGDGIDTIVYDQLLGALTIDLAAGSADGGGGIQGVANFEHFTATGAVAMHVSGTGHANTITTGSGNDVLDGRIDADTMTGGAGNDDYYVDTPFDVVIEIAGEGTDRILSTVSWTLAPGHSIETLQAANPAFGAVNFVGNELANTLIGNAAANTLNGGLGGDTLVGEGGNDTLIGGDGVANTMIGGAGDDLYFVSVLGDSVVEQSAVGSGTDQVRTALAMYTLSSNVENLVYTGTGGFNGIGNALANLIGGGDAGDVLNGEGGADTLSAGLGDDTLIGGSGAANTMIGGAGNDLYFVSVLGDSIVEAAGGGTDQVRTALSFYTLSNNVENLVYIGAGSFNGVGSAVANLIVGGSGNDVLNGEGGSDSLGGGLGNDTLIGGTGDPNSMTGGAGNDIYFVYAAGDSVTELLGEGTDQVRTDRAAYTLPANVENLVYIGSGAIAGTGNGLDNALTGGAGADQLSGLAGNDAVQGADGADILLGGDGDDVLNGGLGNDTLTGGAGADRFLFDTALGSSNIDTVVAFTPGTDDLLLDNAVFTGLANGALAAGAFAVGTAAADADDRIIHDSATGALLFDADGSGAGAAVQFATLTPGLALTSADFLVI